MATQNKPRLRIAVCGAGIAGLTIAAFLSKARDIELHVFEAKSDDRAIGAGIAIWKRCWDILEEMLNFEAECISKGSRLPRWSEVKGPVLRKADKVPYGDFASMPIGPSVLPRAALMNILRKDLSNASCYVQMNKKIVTWEQQGQRELKLYFEDGTSTVVDLLIGADGVHSHVRRRLFEDKPVFSEPEFSGQFAYRMSFPKTEIIKLNPNHEALCGFRIWCGQGRHLTSNTVRDDIQMTAYDNVFNSEGLPLPFDGPWVSEVSATKIAERYEGWDPDLMQLLRVPKAASRWAIHVVHSLPTFVTDRVCLIGDAAHAMTPHQGLGGNQGIEDAYILARLLIHANTTTSNLSDVLGIYDSIRRPASQDAARRSLATGLMYGFLDPKYRGTSLEVMGEELVNSCGWLLDGGGAYEEWLKAQSMLVALPSSLSSSRSV